MLYRLQRWGRIIGNSISIVSVVPIKQSTGRVLNRDNAKSNIRSNYLKPAPSIYDIPVHNTHNYIPNTDNTPSRISAVAPDTLVTNKRVTGISSKKNPQCLIKIRTLWW